MYGVGCVLQCIATRCSALHYVADCCSLLVCGVGCALLCVAVRCSVLQIVAVCCNEPWSRGEVPPSSSKCGSIHVLVFACECLQESALFGGNSSSLAPPVPLSPVPPSAWSKSRVTSDGGLVQYSCSKHVNM